MASPITTVPSLRRLLRRIESASALDDAGDAMQAATARIAPSEEAERVLRGDGIGHALHPLMTDFPLGMWMSANYVDVLGGRRGRPIAAGLIAGGLLTALPTIATGVAEWRTTSGKARRVGVAHAAVNGSGFALYLVSLLLRLVGRHRSAVAVGLLGGVTVTAGGYLGGHLSLVHRVGSADPAFTSDDPPPPSAVQDPTI